MNRYCLDADALITPKNTAYGFDIWPRFWDLLSRYIESGRVYSCWSVYKEWNDLSDELTDWVSAYRDRGLSIPPGSEVQQKYREIVGYVSKTYEDAYAEDFLSGADPWVIAHACADSSTLVTFEKAKAPGAKKVKIPNICDAFDVRCINIYDMVRELKSQE